MRWHREILRRRRAAKSKPKGRPATRRNIKVIVLRMAKENEHRGYRRIAGELASLGITVAPSAVWTILKKAGIEPAPRPSGPTWAQFLPSQAEAILATDFFTVDLLDGTTAYVLTMIEHVTRRIRILGATAHPSAAWTVQMARNVLMDMEDQADRFKFLIRERWHRSARSELLDRTLVWNLAHLRRVLTEYESFYNKHRPHQALDQAAPLRQLPDKVIDLDHFRVVRRDRIGGILHEYHLVA